MYNLPVSNKRSIQSDWYLTTNVNGLLRYARETEFGGGPEKAFLHSPRLCYYASGRLVPRRFHANVVSTPHHRQFP